MLPQPMGWEACEAQLRGDVLAHYRGSDGPLASVGKAVGLILWIWLRDVVLGMRTQGQLVCAGSSISRGAFWGPERWRPRRSHVVHGRLRPGALRPLAHVG